MKRIAIATAVALVVSALPAHATGIGLRWNSCAGASNRSFACDRATGSEVLVGSVSPPGGINEMTGVEITLHIAAADGNVPAWWQMFNPGSCRQFGLQVSFDVSDQMECDDPWEGQAMGGIARYRLDNTAGVNLLIGAAVPSTLKRPLSSGSTYALFKLIVSHQGTSSTGGCTGCGTPVCITFDRLVIAQYSPVDPIRGSVARQSEVTLGLPGAGSTPGNVATWQGGTATCGAGLSKPSSWSQVKDRYRGHQP